MVNFKIQHSFDKRKSESTKIMTKYPDKIPIIVEKQKNTDLEDIDKKKYLDPNDLTFGQFVYVIRKRLNISQEKAIFLFCNNILPPTAGLISQIYNEHKDDDGFLYCVYAGENAFGL